LARKATTENSSNRLEEAMALLIQNQASFLSRLADIEHTTAERFGRIERDMTAILRVLSEHGQLLAEHNRLLERLPEAVREKIGFKGQSSVAPEASPGEGS
jgi:hypothetical protein